MRVSTKENRYQKTKQVMSVVIVDGLTTTSIVSIMKHSTLTSKEGYNVQMTTDA